MNQIDLKNKNAVITGAAQGFGLAISKRFASSGANLFLIDKDETELNIAKETNEIKNSVSQTYAGDITNFEEIESTINSIIQNYSNIDIFVNNAGIAGPSFKTWEYPQKDWKSVVDIDLNGTFNCCKAVVPFMIKQNYGRIVNIASIAGKEGNPNASAYSAAKAGVIALTKSLGKELAEYNIAVNCVTPAFDAP